MGGGVDPDGDTMYYWMEDILNTGWMSYSGCTIVSDYNKLTAGQQRCFTVERQPIAGESSTVTLRVGNVWNYNSDQSNHNGDTTTFTMNVVDP